MKTRYNNFEEGSILQTFNCNKIYLTNLLEYSKSSKNQKFLSIFNNEATSQVLQTRYLYRNLYANQNQKDIKSLSVHHRSIIHDLWPTYHPKKILPPPLSLNPASLQGRSLNWFRERGDRWPVGQVHVQPT